MTDETEAPRHLLSVWNPSYADDAMDQHLEVLLDWAERDAGLRGERDRIGQDPARCFCAFSSRILQQHLQDSRRIR